MFFFFNDTATTEIYTLSLHDALPISSDRRRRVVRIHVEGCPSRPRGFRSHWSDHGCQPRDRKSTRLNSSHGYISYAVFCLKKKKQHLGIRLLRALTLTLVAVCPPALR